MWSLHRASSGLRLVLAFALLLHVEAAVLRTGHRVTRTCSRTVGPIPRGPGLQQDHGARRRIRAGGLAERAYFRIAIALFSFGRGLDFWATAVLEGATLRKKGTITAVKTVVLQEGDGFPQLLLDALRDRSQ